MSQPEDLPPESDSTELAEFREHEVSARENLRRERGDALEKQSWETGWLMLFGFGPPTFLAIALALVFGRPDLVWVFAGLGASVQIWRIWRGRRRIRQIEEELDDPIDGS